jgi:nucleoside-diphosphate-sugar epimerase
LVEGDDILDESLVNERIAGCEAVVHLAAVEDAGQGDALVPTAAAVAPTDLVKTINVGGTRNILTAAAKHSVRRVVYVSSVDVLGCFLGQGIPVYYPIDDAHPTHPKTPYARSKLESESLCAAFSGDTGISTVVLRPPGVFDGDTYTFITEARQRDREFEWSPFWEYGAFIDVHDLAGAIAAAVAADIRGHHCVLVCADDISSAEHDSMTLAQRITPAVPVNDPARYIADPYAALLDCTPAHRLLDWWPQHRWRAVSGAEGPSAHRTRSSETQKSRPGDAGRDFFG